MGYCLLPLLLTVCPCAGAETAAQGFYLGRPAYDLDAPALATTPYVPQPGDIFLASDRALWARAGHWLVGGGGVHHSGIVFRRSDGRMGLIEAGPFNSIRVEVMDPIEHMRDHIRAGERVWMRRRRLPLTEEQSARLTAFVERQEGKPFAVLRLMAQVTPFRTRGPLRTWFVGGPNGDRDAYFCSELVVESCVAAGLMDAATARPSATYPRDLFFGRSLNIYLDEHLRLDDWDPPACWCEGP